MLHAHVGHQVVDRVAEHSEVAFQVFDSFVGGLFWVVGPFADFGEDAVHSFVQFFQSLGDFLGKLSVRYAIVVCEQAEKACPKIWPFTKQRLFWPFENPAAFDGPESERLEKFREVRDLIGERIRQWLSVLMSSDVEPLESFT